MKIKFFKYGYKKYFGINIFIGRFQLRIGGGQFALWKEYDSVFNLLF